jgi:hypothetical protein
MTPYLDSLGVVFDQRIVTAVAVLLAGALLIRSGDFRVRGPAALAVLVAAGNEVAANRWVAFALPTLLVSEVSWQLRVLALGACALAVLGPIWLLYLPLAFAVWFAWVAADGGVAHHPIDEAASADRARVGDAEGDRLEPGVERVNTASGQMRN